MPTLTNHELDLLLAADPARVAAHLGGLYDAATGALGSRIVLYGAGHFGRRTLAGLRRSGVEPLAFADSNPTLWGECIDGLTVLSPADAKRHYAENATFVVNVFHGTPIREELRAEGCRSVVPASYVYLKHAAAFLPYGGYCLPEDTIGHADALRETMALWADDASREAFVAQLRWRLSLDGSLLPPPTPTEETYFIPEIAPIDGETFVDCGAFDGDSVQAFLDRYGDGAGRAIAIEPDPANGAALLRRMSNRADGGKVVVHAAAASSEPGILQFEATGTAASTLTDGGTLTVRAERLDDLLADETPTYLKMDIEGAEMDALRGAAGTIRRHRPVLAICLYHKPEDLWQIPLYIDSLGVDYRYLLRVHAEECWEIVLYAVPAERLRP